MTLPTTQGARNPGSLIRHHLCVATLQCTCMALNSVVLAWPPQTHSSSVCKVLTRRLAPCFTSNFSHQWPTHAIAGEAVAHMCLIMLVTASSAVCQCSSRCNFTVVKQLRISSIPGSCCLWLQVVIARGVGVCRLHHSHQLLAGAEDCQATGGDQCHCAGPSCPHQPASHPHLW